MNKWIVSASAVLAIVSLSTGAVLADDKKGDKVGPCPVCKMPLSSKKTKDNPVAIQLKKGDKTLYCCSKCKMPASVLVKSGGKMSGKGSKM